MKAKARLTIGGGRDFDNGRVSDPDKRQVSQNMGFYKKLKFP